MKKLMITLSILVSTSSFALIEKQIVECKNTKNGDKLSVWHRENDSTNSFSVFWSTGRGKTGSKSFMQKELKVDNDENLKLQYRRFGPIGAKTMFRLNKITKSAEMKWFQAVFVTLPGTPQAPAPQGRNLLTFDQCEF